MEITEHERVLLVNSLIQTISELYEHDGDKDRAALGALLTRMMSRSAKQVPEMTAYVRTGHFKRRAPANLPRSSRPERRRRAGRQRARTGRSQKLSQISSSRCSASRS
jgi:hypothetical protein